MVAPRPAPPAAVLPAVALTAGAPSPTAPLPIAPGETGPGRSWRPSRGFVAVVLVVVAAFGVARLLGPPRTGPPDRTTPGPVVAGTLGGAYAFESVHPDGEPVRWNPCQPIRYVVNFASAPPTAAADLGGALARLSEATGLEFAYEGTTTELPSAHRSPYQPDRYGDRWAPVLVTWHALELTDLPHQEDTVGLGVPVGVVSGRRTQLVSAQVVLNASRELLHGFDTKTSWGGILLHEFGHAIGLGHVGDPGELMYDGLVPRLGSADWGPGDREALRRLGREAGCLPPPEPGPVAFGRR